MARAKVSPSVGLLSHYSSLNIWRNSNPVPKNKKTSIQPLALLQLENCHATLRTRNIYLSPRQIRLLLAIHNLGWPTHHRSHLGPVLQSFCHPGHARLRRTSPGAGDGKRNRCGTTSEVEWGELRGQFVKDGDWWGE